MDFNNIKRRTLLSDYVNAAEVLDWANAEGFPPREAAAYIYRAGLLEGRALGKRKQRELGNALVKAHNEIKTLREQTNNGKLDAILSAVKAVSSPCDNVAQEVETW